MKLGQGTQEFLDALLGTAPSHLWTYIWGLADKQSRWKQVENTAELAATAIALAETSDVYIAVAAAGKEGTPRQRIVSNTAAGIGGFWADIDFGESDVHKKWNLPPNETAARELLDAVGLHPSMIVHSGHGLQVWWLFNEFIEFDTADERIRVAQLVEAWNTTIRIRAAERGWTIDSTFDLARVMRVPGTLNRKKTPVQVQLLELNERRFSLSDFEEYLLDESLLRQSGITPQTTYIVGDIVLAGDAQPPFEKFNLLRDIEPRFNKSWDRTRPLKEMPDQSASSYDLSLAVYAAQAGWSDQEIANLIVASRRHHKDDLKLRPKYYAGTIAKARSVTQKADAADVIEEVVEEYTEAKQRGDEDEAREAKREALRNISEQLGIEVVKIIKFMSTPPSYRIVTPTVGIDLGGAEKVLMQNSVKARVAAETGHVMDAIKSADWNKLMKAFFQIVEEQDVGLASTATGEMYSWLVTYLGQKRPVDTFDDSNGQHPYRDSKGDVIIFTDPFRRWLWSAFGERVSGRDLGTRLKVFGCEPTSVEGRGGERLAAWRLPPEQNWLQR